MKTASLAILTTLCLLTLAITGCRTTSPIDAVRLNQEAQLLLEHGEVAAAKDRLEQSLDADHENTATHYWLGRVHELEGNRELAEYHYRLAIRFAPDMDAPHLALIGLLQNRGKVDASVQATRVFLAHKTNARAAEMIKLAEQFAAQGMDHQAVLAFQKAQELEPMNPAPSLALGEYYLANGKKDFGVDALTHAFMIDPHYPGLAARLGALGQRVTVPEPELFQPTPAIKREMYGLD